MAEQLAAEPLLSRKQIAELLGVSEGTVDRMRRRGELPAPTRVGQKALRWPRSVVEPFFRVEEAPAAVDAK